MEVNQSLSSNPRLLQQMGDSSGYIAIIQPKHTDNDTVVQGLMTNEEYIKQRGKQQ